MYSQSDIQQENVQPSDTFFTMKSVRFYCTPCNRQFSFLNPENGRAVCPRCERVSTTRADQMPQNQTRNTSYTTNANNRQNASQSQSQSRPQQQQQSRPQPQQHRQSRPTAQYFMGPSMFANGPGIFGNSMSPQMFFAGPEYEQEYPQQSMYADLGSLFGGMFGGSQSNGFPGFFGGARQQQPRQTGYMYVPFEYVVHPTTSQPMFRVGDRWVTAQEYERIVEEFIRNDDPNKYGPPPASEESIRKLREYSHDPGVHKHVDCSVCQENYQHGEQCVQLPCDHAYHKDCVLEWLKRHDTCPVCRKPSDTNKMEEEVRC